MRDPQLQRNVHRLQNRIESYQQLPSVIAQVGGKKHLIGRTDLDTASGMAAYLFLGTLRISRQTQPDICGSLAGKHLFVVSRCFKGISKFYGSLVVLTY